MKISFSSSAVYRSTPGNKHRTPGLAALILLLAGHTTAVRADYTPELAAAPYAVDQSVIGIDGWEGRVAGLAVRPDTARLVALRWNNLQPAIRFREASVKNISFPATTGGRVAISFQLATTFAAKGQLRDFRLWFSGAPIGELYFDHSSGLGHHGTGNTKEGTTILQKTEMQANSFYAYELLVDFKTASYDIKVTGQKKDGSPFGYQAQGVEFQKKDKPRGKVDGIYILCGARLPVYMHSLKIQSVPAP